MNLLGISINYKTSPIELREAFHLSESEISELVPLLKKELFSEGFVLSTCNRTEIFGFPLNEDVTHSLCQKVLLDFKKVDEVKEEHFENYYSFAAVKHVFNVAAGLDSLLLGDGQILGQTKTAFQLSEELGFVGPRMKKIFDSTIKAGKRAISESHIGEGSITISYAAVQLIEKIYSDLETKKVLAIGAGETSELAIKHLKGKGATNICVTNRTLSKAEELAHDLDLSVIDFKELNDHLHEFDIIISATSSSQPIVSYQDMKKAMKLRSGNPVCITDIAIPRDFEPKVNKLNNVFYIDIDSLKSIVEQNLEKRKNEIPTVTAIIEEETELLYNSIKVLKIVPTIKQLHNYFETLRLDELSKIKHKIIDDDYEKVEDMTRRLLGRLLHYPTMKLREVAENEQPTKEMVNYSMILKDLYNLNGESKE